MKITLIFGPHTWFNDPTLTFNLDEDTFLPRQTHELADGTTVEDVTRLFRRKVRLAEFSKAEGRTVEEGRSSGPLKDNGYYVVL
ncbi:MAG: hypothetical protein AAB655_02120 [Patescibacteria group bacterium]